jgi:hypothetical protein
MAVTFDAVGPSSAGVGGVGVTSLSWNHVVSGSSTLVAVWATTGVDASTLAATSGGTSMTTSGPLKRHSADSSAGFGQMFYLAGVSAGTVAMSVTGIGSAEACTGGSVSLNGVDQSTPARAVTSSASVGNSANANLTVSSLTGNMVVAGYVCGTSLGAVNGTSETLQWEKNVDGGSGAGNGAESTSAGAATVNFSLTNASDFWAVIGLDVAAAASGAAQATTTTPYIGLWSKDGVLYTGAFDVGIPIRFGLFDDGYVAQFSGTTVGATVTGVTSVPAGLFSKDATLIGAFDA